MHSAPNHIKSSGLLITLSQYSASDRSADDAAELHRTAVGTHTGLLVRGAVFPEVEKGCLQSDLTAVSTSEIGYQTRTLPTHFCTACSTSKAVLSSRSSVDSIANGSFCCCNLVFWSPLQFPLPHICTNGPEAAHCIPIFTLHSQIDSWLTN